MDLYFGPFVHSHQKLPQRSMIDHLEMLTAREQLMEDIDCIIEGFFYDTWGDEYNEDKNELVKTLCDAVCKNFPAN